MPIQVQADGAAWVCDRAPNRCPQCHHAIHALYVYGVVIQNSIVGPATIEICFRCPQSACTKLFIARYWRSSGTEMSLVNTAPTTVPEITYSSEVSELSPNFVQIANEANAAETWGLKEIAGMGYRKALEFLVKDYCISNDLASEQKIKGKALGRVIQEDIADDSIRECARRAVWLGNDETHYTKLWADKDITDLKALVGLTVLWISSKLSMAKYLTEMPERPK